MFETMVSVTRTSGSNGNPNPGVTQFKGEIAQSSFITFADLATQLG